MHVIGQQTAAGHVIGVAVEPLRKVNHDVFAKVPGDLLDFAVVNLGMG